MKQAWASVPLSNIARPIQRAITVEAGNLYRTIGVKLWGEGAYERQTIDGSQTAAKTLSIVREDDLIINKIWVRHGSTAIATKAVDGCAASGEFPTFELDLHQINPRWLHWLTKTKLFWSKCDNLSRGSSGKNRIKPELFLTIEIPLPSLNDQQRIVMRIEELAARIEEARGLRREAIAETGNLLASEEMKVWSMFNVRECPTLADVTTYLSRGRQSKQGESKHYLIKTQHVQMGKYVKTTMTLAPEVMTKVSPEATVQPGDVLIACSAAGCLGRVAFYNDSDVIASTDTHVAIARPNPDKVLPQYLYAYLRGAQGQIQLRSRQKGDWTKEKIGFRLAELNVADMRRVPVPVPSIDEQRRIVDYFDNFQLKVDTLQQLQQETAAELNNLLPSVLDQAFKGKL